MDVGVRAIVRVPVLVSHIEVASHDEQVGPNLRPLMEGRDGGVIVIRIYIRKQSGSEVG